MRSTYVQGGLFESEPNPYEELFYVLDVNNERLIAGDAGGIDSYVESMRAMGYEGEFTIWNYQALVHSYRHDDADLEDVQIDSDLELKVAIDAGLVL